MYCFERNFHLRFRKVRQKHAETMTGFSLDVFNILARFARLAMYKLVREGAQKSDIPFAPDLHTARECTFVKCVKITRARTPKIGFWKTFPPSTTLARLLSSGLASWCTKRTWVYVPAQKKVKNYDLREFSGAKTPPGSPFALETAARSSFLFV
jgi:hypothetical protein